MSVVLHAAVRHFAAGIAMGLVPWVASPPSASFAMAQETADSLDLMLDALAQARQAVRDCQEGELPARPSG